MEQKKTLLLVIDELGRGGAELLLMGILFELNKRYSIILVTLREENSFEEDKLTFKEAYSLGFNKKISLFSCVRKLKNIIRLHNPSLIHSHLFYSSLIARLACPSDTPLIYSLHTQMSKDVFNNSKVLRFLEKNTIRKNHSVIAVSNEVLIDYENTIRKNNHSFVLKNYISEKFLNQKNPTKDLNSLKEIKLVAVGNIKKTKNYIYLIKAFQDLKEYNISLDIYGIENENSNMLKEEIEKYKLPIVFKGPSAEIDRLFPNYDMYVMCSLYEGFGIAAIEAMASGLPLLLSDLPVFHEVTLNNSLFFDVKDSISFVNLIKDLFERKYDLNQLSLRGVGIANQNYTKEIYLKELFAIYDKTINHTLKD